jgi:hypothetical protein
MQACLVRLYMDESFRRLAVLEPETTRKSYDLTDEEFNSLKQIDKGALDLFSVSLRDKRRERMSNHYPLIFALVPLKQMERYYDRFYQLYGCKPEQPSFENTVAFGAFIESTLLGDKDIPPFMAEVARYERLYNSARLSPPPRGLRTIAVQQFPEGDKALDIYPYRADGVFLGDFDYDVTPIVAAMRANQKLPEPQKKPSYIAFKQVRDSRIPKVLELSPELWQLLSACDGVTTTGTLIQYLEKQWNMQGLKDDLLGALKSMHAEGLVSI